MTEGLEVSILNLSDAFKENSVFRIDSQYFKKEYLHEDKSRSKLENILLGKFTFITDGQHGYHEVDESSPIRHLTAKNAKGWFANEVDADRIASWVDENNKRSSLEVDDLILSTRGTVGLCAIVDKDVLPANIDQDVARIKIESEYMSPRAVVAYINSKIGQHWIERNTTGMVQQGLALWRLREMPIPKFSEKLQKALNNIIGKSGLNRTLSKSLYAQAEALLLEAIGLKDFEPSREPVNIKSFKESFLATGRLDAEYYQVKYEEIERQTVKNGFYRIKDVFNLLSSPSPSKYDEQGIKVIKTKNVRIPSVDISGIEDHTNEKVVLVEKNDLLFASMGVGSLGRVSFIEDEIKDCTVDGTLRIFRCKEEYKNTNMEIPALLFLTSAFGQELIYKYVIGSTGIISISLSNIENLIIPKLSPKVREQLSKIVLESIELKKESERLLNLAKQAVEVAIEQGEDAGMKLLS